MKGLKTGGRQKGSVNRRTKQIQDLAFALNVNPIEILLRMASGDWKGLGYENECYFTERVDGSVKMGYTITPEMRLSAAREVAQYLYPKMKEEPPEDDSIEVSLEEKKKLLAQAQEEIEKLKLEVEAEK